MIPTYNCFERIQITLESIKRQNYPNLEVIVIDAGSMDHTLKVINQYSSMVSRVYAVSEYNLPEMINRGIALSTGRYLTFLRPGSFYLSKYAFNIFASRAVKTNFPELIYAGTIQRELRKDPLYLNATLSEKNLQRGIMPTRITAGWFRSDLFEVVGKVRTDYQALFALDLFCRVNAIGEKRVERIELFLVDFDYGIFTYKKALVHAGETWRILHDNFGFRYAISWFFTLNHLQLIRFLFRYLKEQIFKR